ncbi:drug/metabolite transporter (DMT)-like permease [Streptomyces sp. V3I8]|uniref:DMT family transporter n=1 Tax=Streptomyces sp. V3I8 TaxID=3042279 RepID=UPI00278B511A|nr:DMT family transporter [Streptomyces sp. V3I8]MDQ1034604.1 drug/metabolite transporter (DMT)-like permease [Streptomyces sp. V3I8]
MSALLLSVVLSLVSAVTYAGGAIVQERVAATTPDRTYAPMHQAAWWAAVGLNALGGLLHVVALAYGPLSLVQPLGALTIVFALPMAAVFVRRRAGATAWRGAIMATVGLAGLLALVGTADAQSLGNTQRVVVGLVSGGSVLALMTAARAVHRHPAVRSVLLAVAAGIAFGMSSVFTKTVAVDWTGGVTLADLPSLAVIGVLATAGMLLSQASYRGAGLAAPLATLTVVNPIVAAAVGLTMFGETFRHGQTGTMLALACGVVATGGLILLTTERLGSDVEPVGAPERPGTTDPVGTTDPLDIVNLLDTMNPLGGPDLPGTADLPGGPERTRPVPSEAPAGALPASRAAHAPAGATSASFAKAAVLPEQAVAGALRVSAGAGVREKALFASAAGARGHAREETFTGSTGMLASGRGQALVPPPGSNGPPPSGGTPDGPDAPDDETSWPEAAHYGIPCLPLWPAPMMRSCVKS